MDVSNHLVKAFIVRNVPVPMPALEHVTDRLVLPVELPCVLGREIADHFEHMFFRHAQAQMEMIGHPTVGVKLAIVVLQRVRYTLCRVSLSSSSRNIA